MKVLITGASGVIGGEALSQCLNHPSISKVVAFVRRDLSEDTKRQNPKLQCVIIQDFAVWPDSVLEAHADAVGMIWAMGSYNGDVNADLEYPLAFVKSMAAVLEKRPLGMPEPFRCVHLSGKFVRQNQNEKLYFLEYPRKLKGMLETRALEFSTKHPAVWQTFVVRPGGVVPKTILGGGLIGAVTSIGRVMGENWSVRVDQLGAYMVYLATSGEGEKPVVENSRIVKMGGALLNS